MIEMDRDEQQFFKMCRYKEINGKIIVQYIDGFVNAVEDELSII